jgi:hypothetical protein
MNGPELRNPSDAVMRLRLIAAKAEQLASDISNGRLWEGDAARGISEIAEQLRAISFRN